MFKKKKPEPAPQVEETQVQNLDIGKPDNKPVPGKELTLEDALVGMTEIEYKALILNTLGELMERVKVIENEAIQSRNQ